MLKKSLLLVVLALCLPSTLTAKRKTTAEHPKTQVVVKTVYDTVRVVVTDTIKITPKPAPRIDTLQLAHTPAEIDSLIESWSTLHRTVGNKKFLGSTLDVRTIPTKTLDSIYKKRLLDLVSPVHLPYNGIVRDYIYQFVGGRWGGMSKLLALSKYYFPIIDEHLIAAGIPVEMRYLPVIESNLTSKATSVAGAGGLWQIMPSTGKSMGMEINSLVDERCDVIKSTQVACKFLSYLYKVYGDWTLAIAAYNCGPGTVNKAIAMAGSKCRTYWDIYDYLPTETRGYVPKFIAAVYAFNYYESHGITASEPPICIATDTVTIKRIMHFGQVASTLNIPIETLRDLNPQYKLDIVPASTKRYPLRLPMRYVSEFVENEKAIYSKDSLYLKEYLNPANLDKKRAEGPIGYTYTVVEGDNLSIIAKRNRTTVADIKKWNRLTSDFLRPGQKLRINKPKPKK